jgi:hypothetical protein
VLITAAELLLSLSLSPPLHSFVLNVLISSSASMDLSGLSLKLGIVQATIRHCYGEPVNHFLFQGFQSFSSLFQLVVANIDYVNTRLVSFFKQLLGDRQLILGRREF